MIIINKQLLEEYRKQISSNLKYLLDIYSINVLDLASKLELSYTPIYNLATGCGNPTLDTLLKVSNYFNISISQFIGDLPINKINSTNYLKMIPVLQWREVSKFLCVQYSIKPNDKQLLISSEHLIPQTAFALHANEKTEPLFKIGTILIFDKAVSDIEIYDNKYVLLSSDKSPLTIKKLFVEESIIFTQSINTLIPPQPLLDNVRVLAYLIQTRLDFYNT
ncbi:MULTISPECIES: helix-turn-helix transcriptional regulator [unclassified Candidatus Tisiphia]|uniref:helix-turn-helix domain-containing protein n=1 Tax=unclassified Candidatus Tisiphia TaxID=2996318 RepID=UPI00312C9900